MFEKLRNLLDTCRLWQSEPELEWILPPPPRPNLIECPRAKCQIKPSAEKGGCAVSLPQLASAVCFTRPISRLLGACVSGTAWQIVWVGHISSSQFFGLELLSLWAVVVVALRRGAPRTGRRKAWKCLVEGLLTDQRVMIVHFQCRAENGFGHLWHLWG